MIIRPYTNKDEKAVIDICFNTRDYMEDLKDSYLFSLRWAQCYLRYYPEFCFVAEENGEVIGYILSTPDTEICEKTYLENILPEIKNRIDSKDKYYEDFTSFITANDMGDTIADDYPAHLHINLTPKCQHKGIGSKLMKVMEQNLIAHGVKAIHLGVMADNTNAVNFYKKHNYKILVDYDFGDNEIGYFMGKNLN